MADELVPVDVYFNAPLAEKQELLRSMRRELQRVSTEEGKKLRAIGAQVANVTDPEVTQRYTQMYMRLYARRNTIENLRREIRDAFAYRHNFRHRQAVGGQARLLNNAYQVIQETREETQAMA